MEVKTKPHLHQDWIDSHAHGIVKALQKNGFPTYLVGGCVRDLMLGIHPKDFDIATAAVPQQVKRLIYMSFVIGKRFRLVLVKRDELQFEVATFRRELTAEDIADPNTPAGDNVFGTPEEDARRRDFTVNALFYDPVNEQLIDFVDGRADIESRILRMIGDPERRLIEDPIRILRGLRFAHKLGFTIEANLRTAMTKHAAELQKSVLPRRREEILKILRLPHPDLALIELFDLGILRFIVPTLDEFFQKPAHLAEFLAHFNRLSEAMDDPTDTTQLFAGLVFSLIEAAAENPETEPAGAYRIQGERIQNMLQNELGMFKYEQSKIIEACKLIPLLKRTEDFRRRGERRQLSLVKSEGFRLALLLAASELHLTGPQMLFWLGVAEKLAPQLQHLQQIEQDSKVRKRRRPRSRRAFADRRSETSSGIAEATSGEDSSGEDDAEPLPSASIQSETSS